VHVGAAHRGQDHPAGLADEADRVRGDLGLQHADGHHAQVGQLAAGEPDELFAGLVDVGPGPGVNVM
jgi:hypothetical protein